MSERFENAGEGSKESSASDLMSKLAITDSKDRDVASLLSRVSALEAEKSLLREEIDVLEAKKKAFQHRSKLREETIKGQSGESSLVETESNHPAGKVVLMAKALEAAHKSVGYARIYMRNRLAVEEMANIDSPGYKDGYWRLYEACPQMGKRVIVHHHTELFDKWEAEDYEMIEEGDRRLTADGKIKDDDEDMSG